MNEARVLDVYLYELKNILNFKGRVSKRNFCRFLVVHGCVCCLLSVLIGLCLYVTQHNTESNLVWSILTKYLFKFGPCLFSLIILVMISILVRRLHDIGKSGTWAMVYSYLFIMNYWSKTHSFNPIGSSGILCLIGFVLLFRLFRKGKINANKFGKANDETNKDTGLRLNLSALVFFVFVFLFPIGFTRGISSEILYLVGFVLLFMLFRKGKIDVNKFGKADNETDMNTGLCLNLFALVFFVFIFLLPMYAVSFIEFSPCGEVYNSVSGRTGSVASGNCNVSGFTH